MFVEVKVPGIVRYLAADWMFLVGWLRRAAALRFIFERQRVYNTCTWYVGGTRSSVVIWLSGVHDAGPLPRLTTTVAGAGHCPLLFFVVLVYLAGRMNAGA